MNYTMRVAWRRFKWWPIGWPFGIRYDTWDHPGEPDWNVIREAIALGMVVVSIDPPPPPDAGIEVIA